MEPVTIASFISLAKFALEQVDRYKNGDMTEEELTNAWANLQIRRDETKQIWADAKAAGGYT